MYELYILPAKSRRASRTSSSSPSSLPSLVVEFDGLRMDAHALTSHPPSPDTWRKIVSELCHIKDPVLDEFSAFMGFYKQATCNLAGRIPPWGTAELPGLQSHDALLEAVPHLRQPDQTKAALQAQLFGSVSDTERKRCVRLLVSCAFMVDCASRDDFSAAFLLHSEGGFPSKWDDEQTLEDWILSTFPRSPGTSFSLHELRRPIRGWELEKRGIRIVPTDDLSQHLFYNREAKTLSVFHQVAYLRALVRGSSAQGLDLSTPCSKSIE
jgi:hypothetical protein